ncbi:hypothetical protein [Achromobacter sp. 2789STDY5608633]|uniref:hypothetical protein n=1 Tax=Achromobacter sp. 2789STDY5608633 TaxID=1806501 RepID=UPI0012E29FA9|nr:hypothetical protein [Achromobacter sp. 2789STDY5608633]
MTITHRQPVRTIPLPLWVATFSLATLLAAAYLRGAVGHPFREAVTHFLGYEARAAVEHFASAIAFPLLNALPFWSFTGGAYARASTGRADLRNAARAWLEQWNHLVVLGAAGYLACCFVWEWNQAYVGTSKLAPRGFIQWEQLAADVAGALVAILVAQLLKQRHHC